MILTIALLFTLLIAGILSLIFGAAFFVVFGDVIVFGLIIGLFAKLLRKKKKS